jgi:hypothetical protein
VVRLGVLNVFARDDFSLINFSTRLLKIEKGGCKSLEVLKKFGCERKYRMNKTAATYFSQPPQLFS